MSDIVARLRAEIAWEPDVGDLLSQAADHIDSLRQEVKTQRLEIAALRGEQRPLGLGFEDYADEHAAIEDQLKSLGLPLPDCCCMPTTDELSAVMVDQIKRLRTQVQLLTDEAARLRLTAPERAAIREALAANEQDEKLFGDRAAKADAKALRGLLERTK